MDRSYIAFISYRHTDPDKAVAEKLHQLIERYHVPRGIGKEQKRLGIAFRDQEELPVSGDLGQDIYNALDHSEFLIVVCSPRTPESMWVTREIEYFLSHHDYRHVLTVLVEGEPDDSFPHNLTHPFPDEPERMIEPLAADVRAENPAQILKKLKHESLRLFAGMLGVPYDSLAQREQKRRRRILAVAGGIILAALLSYAGILLYSNAQISAKNAELETANTTILEQNDALEDANTTLQEQKEALQRSESSLLAESAARSLAAGDYESALSQAAAALPQSETDERPYCAEAESVLSEALLTYRHAPLSSEDPAGPAVSEIVLTTAAEQETVIRALLLSEDGTAAYTLDQYGAVRCLNRETGEEQWKTNLLFYSSEIMDSGICFEYSAACSMLYISYIPTDPEKYLNTSTVTALNCSDGSVAWTWSDPAVTVVRTGQLVLSADGSRLAYLTDQTGTPSSLITFLSAGTGEAQAQFALSSGHGKTEQFLRSDTPSGTFAAEDASLFAGIFYAKASDGSGYVRSFYLVDLNTGACSILYNDLEETQNAPRSLHYSADAHTLTLVTDSPNENAAALLMQLDTADGRLLWQSETPDTGTRTVWKLSGTSVLYDDENSRICLGRQKRLYLLDTGTGTLLAEYRDSDGRSQELPGTVLSLFPAGSGAFGFLLDNGTTGCAWQKENALAFKGCTADVGACIAGTAGSGGLRTADPSAEPALTGWADGLIVCVPADNDHMVRFNRHFTVSCPWTAAEIETLEDVRVLYPMSPGRISCTDGSTATYIQLSYNKETGQYEYRITALDAVTQEKSTFVYTQDEFTRTRSDHLPVLSMIPSKDGSGLLVDPGNGDLRYYHPDTGISDRLWTVENRSPYSDADTQGENFASGTTVNAVRILKDGTAFGAVCDGTFLHLWRDGEALDPVPLPEGVQWNYVSDNTSHRMLAAGENGCVVLSNYAENTGRNAMTGFAVYSAETGSWSVFADEAAGTDIRPVCFSPAQTLLAVGDADNTLRLYDTQSGSCIRRLSLPVPGTALRQIGFSTDGSWLYAVSGDDSLFIYDPETGEMVYRTVLECGQDTYTAADSPVDLIFDAAQNRLYIQVLKPKGTTGCICLDTRSFTPVAQMSAEVAAVLPEYNTVLVKNFKTMLLRYIPSTLELTRAAVAMTEAMRA